MQEDEIDVCNNDSFANNSCVDYNNLSEYEPSTSPTQKQPSNQLKQSKIKHLLKTMILINKNCFSFYIGQ